MMAENTRSALYYPFHLCHEQTLARLLIDYPSVHFRDYMALQLTQMSGTTAYADRMGERHADLVKSGLIVQGYSVSGPLDQQMISAVNRDLNDATWREQFHHALINDRRFQRGLFELMHGMLIGGTLVPGPAAWLRLIEKQRQTQPYSVEMLQKLSDGRLDLNEGYDYEYALALVKTSAALHYTFRLAIRHALEAVTDSKAHYDLLERMRTRDRLTLQHQWIAREEY
ncbi:MAG: hypothetical protein M3Z35_12540 [Nitrospirota bacterium]|nr:hypothetical protein [Nitrospirota bacterium]